MKRENVAAVYELTPLQQGMFIHSRYGGEKAVYLTQFQCRLRGELEVEAFHRAWQRVVDRHPVLRSSFHWKDLDKPLQVVHKQTEVPLECRDWRALGPAEQDAALDAFLAEDRARGFELEKAPLLRLSLLRASDVVYHLVWSHHHLLLDGWSVHRVMAEVLAFYRLFCAGRDLELPLPRPYRDFVLWQKQQDLGAAESYWRGLLAGFDAPTPLAEGRTAPPPERDYGRVIRWLGAATVARLEAAARRERVTLNTLFQAAWGLLLATIAGQREVVFGATTAGRPAELAGVETMVGMFINTLPVRLAYDPRLTVGDFLRRVQEQQGQSRRFEWTPLASIQRWSPVPAGTPLFESLMIFENLPAEPPPVEDGGRGAIEVLEGGFIQRTHYPLTYVFSPRGAEHYTRIAYDTTRFDTTAIARMLDQLEGLLEALAARPAARLGELSPLTPAERHLLLREWNDRPAAVAERTLPEIFAAQVAQTPEALAVLVDGREVSYAELWQKTSALAATLRERGVGPDQIVAVCAERSLEMLVAVLAVLEAGGAYLPLDPGLPTERIEFLLADSGARWVLAVAGLRPRFSGTTAEIVALDGSAVLPGPPASLEADNGPRSAGSNEDGPSMFERSESRRPARSRPGGPGDTSPANLAYVIYTSGSTGQPKGVMVAHGALADRILDMVEIFRFGPGQRQLQFVSLGFDMACEEIFLPLACGGALVLERDIQARTPLEVLATVERRGVTKVNLPASYWHQLVEDLEERDQRVPACLDILATGAESPSPEKLRRWGARTHHGARLYNGYGPTETVMFATTEPFTLGVSPIPHRGKLPIGRAIRATALYLLDAAGRPVPLGVAGELWIGGADLARGYLRRPGLTAERFGPDGFSGVPGARLYRTGDLVRLLPDGRLEFVGRVDFQVKIRGFRIELGEIEEALRRHPGVAEAAALVREDRPGEKRLVGYVVPAGEASAGAPAAAPGLRELRAYLGEHLPEHMVPAFFVFLDRLPLNANNKLDRKALPAPGAERPELETEYLAPRTELEQHLAGLWRDILGVERVGVRDNFFELGGDSIRGAIFINRLEAKLGEYVYVVALFDSPTVEGFARYLSGHCPAAVEKHFGRESLVQVDAPAAAASGRMGAAELAQVRAIIEPLAPFAEPDPSPNPPAAFVLSPPRSGSTLLRVMLGGNPALFAPPELDLLSFNTLAERSAAFSGRFSFWLEGTLRALMELEGCDAEQARRIMAEHEARGATVKELYRDLQTRLGGRLLVDKTPSYALDLKVLRRAEIDFENTRYVHLLRHPCGMIQSFEKARIDELFFRWDHPWTPRQLGELIWQLSHLNILAFFREIPAARRHVVRYEELVEEPRRVIEGLCEFLGVDFEPAMLDPYGDTRSRMTDGIHPLAKMLGDVKFHTHGRIDPKMAWRWREVYSEDFLGEDTWGLAAQLGYEKPAAWRGPAPAARREEAIALLPRDADGGGRFALSFAQERLWVIDRLVPGNPGYNMPAAVRVRGRLDGEAFARALAELTARHETLRTAFAEERGQPVQVVLGRTAVRPVLEHGDLQALAGDEQERALRRLAGAEAVRAFDLAQAPLLRAHLVRLGAEEHALLLTIHHAVSDGWSQGILVRELATLYAAAAEQREAGLEPLPLQYADFAAWQRGWLAGARLEAQLAVWRARLLGAPALLELPTDRPRPAVASYRGGRRRGRLGGALPARLRTLAQKHEATPFMVLLAGFAALLARWSGQDDVVVGSPIANRPRRELEALIGFFVNTLALRLDTGGDPSFAELLARTRALALEAFANPDLPFEKLVEELHPERSLAHQPIFQVLFVLQNASLPGAAPGALELGGLRFEPVEVETTTAKFDLGLSLGESPDGFVGSIEYASDLFDATTIERVWRRYDRLLAAMTADPGSRVAEVSLLSAAERQQLAVEWNATAQTHVLAPLHVLIAQQAARTPDAVAVVFEDAALSYAGLVRAARQLARRLRARGVRPEDFVGVAMERSLELMVALLGVLEAGAAYVPIEPALPAARREVMIGELRRGAAEPVVLDAAALDGAISTADGELAALEPATDLDQAVYAIYTSGSTGRPKGVVNSHRGVANRLLWAQSCFGLGPADTVLQKTPFGFDVSVWELFWPLMVGSVLEIARPEGHRDPAYLAAKLRTARVTTTHFVPSMLHAFLDEAETQRFPALRRVLASGEALSPELARRFMAGPGRRGAELHNLYGPTEAAIDVTWWPCPLAQDISWVPIGRPTGNVVLHVLDRGFRPVPPGVAGELLIGGVQVARGYLARPGLSAERFVPDPFGAPGERLYRTGDLTRWRVSGEIEYLGRLDHQVKIRGLRIELGEIETVLARQSGVERAVVLARDHGAGDRRLAAYLVLKTGVEPSAAFETALRTAARAELPEYMVPASCFTVERLPLSANGKLDRGALVREARPFAGGAAGEGAGRAPEGELETALAAIFEELLGRRGVRAGDDFFELGGHSLLAVRLLAEIRARLGRELPLAALFGGGTVERLARRLGAEAGASGQGAGAASPVVEIQPGAGRALFCIHPAGGNVLCYRELARALGLGVRVCGLEARGLRAGEEPLTSIEAMAERHLEALRAVQPTGPYALLGWSLGGLIAYELACRLAAAGERAEPLVLVDVQVRQSGRREVASEAELLAAVFEGVVEIDAAELAALGAGDDDGAGDGALAAVLAKARAAGAVPAGFGVEQARRYLRVFLAGDEAAARYAPPRYAGSVVVVKASEASARREGDASLGWAQVVEGELVLTSAPGSHHTMLSPPHVEKLARRLEPFLAES